MPQSPNNKGKPWQPRLFGFSEPAHQPLPMEGKIRWYYLASPRSDHMVTMTDEGHTVVPHDLQHEQPWITNSRKNAVRVAIKVPGIWKVKIYPYNPR